MALYEVYDIEWDTDGESVPDLPSWAHVPVEDEENIDEEVAEYLSETYGWLTTGSSVEKIN